MYYVKELSTLYVRDQADSGKKKLLAFGFYISNHKLEPFLKGNGKFLFLVLVSVT